MKALTETVISFFDLLEAEGRLLQRKIIQTLVMSLFIIVAGLLVIGSVAFLVAAFYQWLVLTLHWSIPGALFFISLFCLVLAGIILWGTLQVSRKV